MTEFFAFIVGAVGIYFVLRACEALGATARWLDADRQRKAAAAKLLADMPDTLRANAAEIAATAERFHKLTRELREQIAKDGKDPR